MSYLTTDEDLAAQIAELRKRRNAVILAHNYQLPEVQKVADHVGDSLDLSRKAAQTDAEVVVFCGVHFMAETAALLSPEKVVLLPEQDAGCPMADMIDAESLRGLKAKHPDSPVVCYVNSTAAVKAEVDVCCTSANAVEVVSRLQTDAPVIFVPDQYLGGFVQRKTGREMILWPGFCPTHMRFTTAAIDQYRKRYPDAEVMVHPESRTEVSAAADFALGTGGMCAHAKRSKARRIVVGTEVGLLHRLRKENPDKEFLALNENAVCPNMKLTGLESVVRALETMQHTVVVPPELRDWARASVERMVAVEAAA